MDKYDYFSWTHYAQLRLRRKAQSKWTRKRAPKTRKKTSRQEHGILNNIYGAISLHLRYKIMCSKGTSNTVV